MVQCTTQNKLINKLHVCQKYQTRMLGRAILEIWVCEWWMKNFNQWQFGSYKDIDSGIVRDLMQRMVSQSMTLDFNNYCKLALAQRAARYLLKTLGLKFKDNLTL